MHSAQCFGIFSHSNRSRIIISLNSENRIELMIRWAFIWCLPTICVPMKLDIQVHLYNLIDSIFFGARIQYFSEWRNWTNFLIYFIDKRTEYQKYEIKKNRQQIDKLKTFLSIRQIRVWPLFRFCIFFTSPFFIHTCVVNSCIYATKTYIRLSQIRRWRQRWWRIKNHKKYCSDFPVGFYT